MNLQHNLFKHYRDIILRTGFKPVMFEAGTSEVTDFYLGVQLKGILDLYDLGNALGIHHSALGLSIYDYKTDILWFPSRKLTKDDYEWMVSLDTDPLHH